nr:MAG TPA: replisome organizer [Caudoviricetes sp.]
MGNRILKESIRTDQQINKLSDFQFRLWTYLLTYVDDYGRGNADADLVKGFCFARRKDVTAKAVEKGLLDLQEIGLIKLYRVEDETYFHFPSWEKHQRIQSKNAKHPAPPEKEEDYISTVTHGNPPLPTVSHGDLQNSTVTHGNPPPEVEVELEEELNITSTVVDVCSELKSSKLKACKKEPAVFELPTNTGEAYPFYSSDIDSYKSLYPAVDVEQEMRKMIGWLDANPTRRKTKTGMKRFVNNWLSSEQDKYKPVISAQKKSKFNNFEQRNDEIDAEMNDKFLKVIKGG